MSTHQAIKWQANKFVLLLQNLSKNPTLPEPATLARLDQARTHLENLQETPRPPYTYTALSSDVSEIRLLHIKSSYGFNAPMRCTLEKTDLDQGLEFKALSYVWGDFAETIEITVNGCSFMVSLNLFAALHHIRSSYGETAIWIDAICTFLLSSITR
jgi:hypothetical protein